MRTVGAATAAHLMAPRQGLCTLGADVPAFRAPILISVACERVVSRPASLLLARHRAATGRCRRYIRRNWPCPSLLRALLSGTKGGVHHADEVMARITDDRPCSTCRRRGLRR